MATKDPSPQEFPTTWWSLIDQAAAGGAPQGEVALDELVQLYLPPLRAHLVVRRRLSKELADDLLQAFVAEKILARYLLQHADRSKGKFRSLLLRSLDNYFIQWQRKQAQQPPIAATDVADVADAPLQADIFDIAWARQLLDEVIAEMRAECETHRQQEVWGVFEHRLLAPIRNRAEPLGYEAICRRFGFNSPAQASNALVTAKRKFQRVFERVSLRHCHDGEDSQDVLRELVAIVGQADSADWQRVPDASAASGSICGGEWYDSEPQLVATVLGQAPNFDARWPTAELGSLWRHQLSQHLLSLNSEMDDLVSQTAADCSGELPPVTVADLLFHPKPPLPLLGAVMRLGDDLARNPHAMLQEEIALGLYYSCVAVALVRHDRRIDGLPDDVLRDGLKQFAGQPWIDGPLGELLTDAASRVRA